MVDMFNIETCRAHLVSLSELVAAGQSGQLVHVKTKNIIRLQSPGFSAFSQMISCIKVRNINCILSPHFAGYPDCYMIYCPLPTARYCTNNDKFVLRPMLAQSCEDAEISS